MQNLVPRRFGLERFYFIKFRTFPITIKIDDDDDDEMN